MAMMSISGSCRPMTLQWRVLDSVLCLVVFSPSMLFYWRGIWDLYGVYIFPGDEFASNWAVFGLGCTAIFGYFLHPGLAVALNIIRPGNESAPMDEEESHHVITVVDNVNSTSLPPAATTVKSKIDVVKGNGRSRRVYRIVYVISTRFYMYLFGISAMAYWRGVWLLIDYYLLDVDRLIGSLAGLVTGYSLLVALRCSRSLIFPPFVVALDTRPDLLVPSPRFQTKVNWRNARSFATYALDSMVTHYVIVTLTIVTWRSTLALYDVILAFEDPVMADVTSVLIGILCCSLMFAAEGSLARFAVRWQGWLRLAVHDVITFLQFASEAFLWRGAWNLNARFLIPDPLVGGWTNHIIGTVLLMSLQLFSYVGSCGCTTDGETRPDSVPSDQRQNDGDSSLYSTKYLRHYYVERRLGDKALNGSDVATPSVEEEPLKSSASCTVGLKCL